MVLMATSPVRSRNSRQRAGVNSPRAPAVRSVVRIRSRISAAAFRVKVSARISDGSTPSRSRLT
jgi:hypothetical protein